MLTTDERAARPGGRDHVHPNMQIAYERAGVPSAYEVDGWVFLTGVVAARGEDEGGDLKPGFERTFRQLGEVLAMAGCSWANVVKMTSFHIDIARELPVMAEVRLRYVAPPYHAWSVIGAASLANPAGFCEIEVTARKPAA
ncbi:Rid family hydrolase [Sphingomonas canadensis]|uniref:Rid family hydrolase n=1 Tax=Sphingomonas canadensis TaxID=1219257 RepID=A0ABW3H4U2_9SPHN|nr:Rid family hydrolase [Sphingomonas canadensis]MCW3836195.1 Rid family hydrolase [Sphingomonas canadensis]